MRNARIRESRLEAVHHGGMPVLMCAVLAAALAAGCRQTPATSPTTQAADVAPEVSTASACLSLLFVGNSHTTFYELPSLIGKMVEFCRPSCGVHVETIGVSFLEDLATHAEAERVLDSRRWDVVFLQGQKISQSGRFVYSQKAGIEFAKRARERKARVFFYSEWGLQGVKGDAERIARINGEMAAASGARVTPVGRAWDLALARRPNLPLYAADGNHQSALGAFLTGCVLTGCVLDERPACLAAFDSPEGDPDTRRLLVDAAVDALRRLEE